MTQQMKPCPFCGGKANPGWFGITHNIGCDICQYSLDTCKEDVGCGEEDIFNDDVENAILALSVKRWNTRA